MLDSSDPERSDSEDLFALGLHVAFQAKQGQALPALQGPVLSRIESQVGLLTSVSLQPPLREDHPVQALAAHHVPSGVGRYKVLGEIGRGGLGIVLKARDTDLGRETAMKVLLDPQARSQLAIQRFVEEAQITGQLQHPGIVPVYEMGLCPDSSPYFTMKLVNGRTFEALLASRSGSSEERMRFLQIFEQACQAVAYAHSRGVVHRDLKPSNLMVGAFGEVQVMDWGLSKVIAPGATNVDSSPMDSNGEEGAVETARSRRPGSRSLQGTVMGTPAYMSPEQARGEVAVMDERSDVFSLGAMLCEILTGEPLYRGESPREICRLASNASTGPAFARLDSSGADDELVRIAKRSLAARPDDRPRNAGVIAEEVRAHISSVEERARAAELARARESARATSERKARRLTVALAAFILLAMGLGSGAYYKVTKDRLSREEISAFAIQKALEESSLLLGQARSSAGNEVSAWSEALQAARRAESLATTGGASATLRARVDQVLDEILQGEGKARIEAARSLRNRKMKEMLEEIRLSRADPGVANWRKLDEDYGQAFRGFGIDVDGGDPEAVGKSLRESLIRGDLISALDEWTRVRMALEKDAPDRWKALSGIAAATDPDPLMVRLRGLAHSGNLEQLRTLVADPAVAELSASSACMLAQWLDEARDLKTAISVCRGALGRHPDDFWLNTSLGIWLLNTDPPDLGASSRYLTAAVALRPNASRAWNNLGYVLFRLKDLEAALNAYRQALLLDPDSYHACNNLGGVLVGQGDLDAAIPLLRKAVRIGPGFPEGWMSLGVALEKKGSLEEAAQCFREAAHNGPQGVRAWARLGDLLEAQGDLEGAAAAYSEYVLARPGDASAHAFLGTLHALKRDPGRAIPEFREAIRLKPGLAVAHGNLGSALLATGDVDGGIAALREAVRLDPTYGEAYANLAAAQHRAGKPEEALAACREAIRLKPDHGQAHMNLGACLEDTGDMAGAVAAFKEASRLLPDAEDVQLGLGRVLEESGQYTEALEVYRKAVQRGLQNPKIGRECEEGLNACVRKLELVSRLDGFLAGSIAPAGALECVELARICHARARFGGAVKFWTAAFDADPGLASSPGGVDRYNAACAAALAGCGRGLEEQGTDDRKRAAFRLKALDWLRSDLAEIRASSEVPGSNQRRLARRLSGWRKDPDLASLRAGGCAGQPSEEEYGVWTALWADVDDLLATLSSTGVPATPR